MDISLLYIFINLFENQMKMISCPGEINFNCCRIVLLALLLAFNQSLFLLKEDRLLKPLKCKYAFVIVMHNVD